MDNVNIFAKNEKELETLLKAIKNIDPDIRIEFVIEECAMLMMEKGKREKTEGIELLN